MNRAPVVDLPLRVLRDRGTSLPAPLTSFIGREKVLGEVVSAVASHRLLTLIGPGGSGKTRLAIEAARTVSSAFEDDVTWVELAPITDPTLVPQTLATAFGIRHQPGRAAGDAVAEYLGSRRALLVLDNCEHVVEAAAELVSTLLHAAPNIHVLITSRERIAVPGERAWPVPPLGLPSRHARDMDTLLDAEAVRLFIDRASAVLPAFAIDAHAAAAIADICLRVDGIPLAIELAAARMNVLAPRQIADRLADAMTLLTTGARTLPKRQRTLRAAIDWSYRLLTEPERTLFQRLSVFAGSFPLEAAEAVCSDDVLPGCDVLDLLASLVDKSLVTVSERHGEARYRMLDTVDQFATELLDAEGGAHATRMRHAEHYALIVERYAPRLRSAARPRVMPVFDAALDNIRAALDFTRDTPGCADLHHRLVSGLWWYWLHRVQWDEGLDRMSAAIALGSTEANPARFATTLYGAGLLAWVSGVFLQSRMSLERCVEMRSNLDDPGALGMAMCALAPPVNDLGDRDAALALIDEGMPLVRAHCTPWDVAVVLTTAYGYVHHAAGAWDDAEKAYLEADALWSDPADDWGRSLTRNSLAVVAWRRDDVTGARSHARQSLELLRSVGDRWFAARTLQVLGYISVQRGEYETGTQLLAASEAQRSDVGARLMPFEVPEWSRAIELAQRALGTESFDTVWAAGIALDFDAAIDFAMEHGAPAASTSAGRSSRQRDANAAVVGAAARAAAPQEAALEWPGKGAELTIRALGALEVQREGRALTNEDWTYARPRELLFYLLCHPEGRTKDQIGLDLWPEASPAQLRSSFHVTVHHLRRALGASEWISFEEGRYRFDTARECAYDVAHFRRCVGDARALRPRTSQNDMVRRVRLLEAAVDIYRGEFLEDASFGDWTLQQRDELRRIYADAAAELAAYYHAERRYDEAADTCRALLGRDNLDERAHRLLIEVLADAGRRADAMRHHSVLVALFREELGIAPSAETAALVARISHSA